MFACLGGILFRFHFSVQFNWIHKYRISNVNISKIESIPASTIGYSSGLIRNIGRCKLSGKKNFEKFYILLIFLCEGGFIWFSNIWEGSRYDIYSFILLCNWWSLPEQYAIYFQKMKNSCYAVNRIVSHRIL